MTRKSRFRFESFLLLFVALLCFPLEADDKVQTWTDVTGKFKVDAKFVRIDGENLVIEREDGTIVNVALSKLSRESLLQVVTRLTLNPMADEEPEPEPEEPKPKGKKSTTTVEKVTVDDLMDIESKYELNGTDLQRRQQTFAMVKEMQALVRNKVCVANFVVRDVSARSGRLEAVGRLDGIIPERGGELTLPLIVKNADKINVGDIIRVEGTVVFGGEGFRLPILQIAFFANASPRVYVGLAKVQQFHEVGESGLIEAPHRAK